MVIDESQGKKSPSTKITPQKQIQGFSGLHLNITKSKGGTLKFPRYAYHFTPKSQVTAANALETAQAKLSPQKMLRKQSNVQVHSDLHLGVLSDPFRGLRITSIWV